MRFIVRFTDDETQAHQRQRFMADHLEFLTKNNDAVMAAGPLIDPQSGQGAGGLWIVEAEDRAAVWELVEQDPFFPTGLRKDIQILQWKMVFDQGRVLLNSP